MRRFFLISIGGFDIYSISLAGCSSAWLECVVWDHEAAGSNPVTPKSNRLAGRSSAWLECLVRDQEAAGSNPVAPTIFFQSVTPHLVYLINPIKNFSSASKCAFYITNHTTKIFLLSNRISSSVTCQISSCVF